MSNYETVFCDVCRLPIDFDTEPYYHSRSMLSHGHVNATSNDCDSWTHRLCVDGPEESLFRLGWLWLIEYLPLWAVKRMPDWPTKKKRPARIEGLGQP